MNELSIPYLLQGLAYPSTYYMFTSEYAKAALLGGFCVRDAERYCTDLDGGRY